MTYIVWVDDNYHYMDEDERYKLGEFKTLDAAIAACKKIVDDFLASTYAPGMSAAELNASYTGFGEDPWIAGEERVLFSAWTYAEQRCAEICGGKG
jgi:hypothetical protein